MRGPDFGRLHWRLLAASFVVAAAGIGAVIAAAALTAPRAFEEAMGHAGEMGMSPGMGSTGMMDPLLRTAFGEAVGSALLLGLVAALAVAIMAAALLATWISRPIGDLAAASARVSKGDYSQPVPAAPGELGELAISFNHMARALEANEQRRHDLIGDVAHELRTPITSVRGYVEGLMAGVFEPGPQAWRILDEQTSRLEHLVDDLALLWRAESNDLRLDRVALDGPALLADLRERHRTLAASRSVDLVLGSMRSTTVRADPVRLAQVLDNLVGNALRFTPPGGRVELGLSSHGAAAEITVRDDGPGLAPEQAARVFERFYRGDPSRSREGGGSGLGLAISKSLVEAMGGSIVVASPGAGRGTTFTVRLPAA